MSTSPTKRTHKDPNGNASKDASPTAAAHVFPECWRDEKRRAVLLAPFRTRSVNPENYDSKMKFWQEQVAAHCERKGAAHFSKQELQLAFAHGQSIPYGLDTVLEEMLRSKKIRRRAEYEYDPADSWTGWAMTSFVKRPLSWGVHKVKATVWAEDEERAKSTLEYVHLEAMKKFCKDLQTKVLQQQQGALLHYEALQALIGNSLNLTEECAQMCLHTLQCQRKIDVEYREESGERTLHLIKIPSKTDENVSITESDRAVHNLQMTQTKLLKQLEHMEEEIKENDTKARQYLKENKRQLAKTYLRKKHLLEKNHEKRSIALHNIETLLSSVNEAQSHGEILDAYKIGSRALQNALNESGLKYDNVDEVISEVRESIETHNELQDTLANANLPDNTAYDNDALEQELAEIMGEATVRPKATQKPKAAANAATNNNQNAAPRQVEITDAELLAMLEGLEVEQNSLSQGNTTTQSNATAQ